MVKLDVDTVATVPDAPPAAGPDRALDPPPPDPKPPPEPAPVAVGVGEVAGVVDVPQADTAITTPSSPAATIHRLFRFDGGLDVALETGRAGKASWGLVGS
jgi:hypothetical protein